MIMSSDATLSMALPVAKALPPSLRLAHSHLRLRLALIGPADCAAAAARLGIPTAIDSLGLPPKDLPLSTLLWTLVKRWVGPHPAHAAAGAMASVANLELRPIATRHPFGMALAAAALGAIAMRTRSWRGWTTALPLAAALLRFRL